MKTTIWILIFVILITITTATELTFDTDQPFFFTIHLVNGSGLWNESGTNLLPYTGTINLRIPSLSNCDTIDTDADGVMSCGADADSGAGSLPATTYYVANISDVLGGTGFNDTLLRVGNISDILIDSFKIENGTSLPFSNFNLENVSNDTGWFNDSYAIQYALTGFKTENGTSFPFSAFTLENVSNDTGWFNSSFDTQYALTGFKIENGTSLPFSAMTLENISNVTGVKNKSEYVQFTTINMSVWASKDGTSTLTQSDDGSSHFLTSNVEGNNYLEIATTGGFMQLYGNPGPSNDDLLFTITETQGADTEMNFYEGGAGNNRFWSSGSVRIGGIKGSTCSSLDSRDIVDCDTSDTGADLVIEDDLLVIGAVYTVNGSINLTGSGSIFVNGTIFDNGTINRSIDLSGYISDASTYQTEASAWKIENETKFTRENASDQIVTNMSDIHESSWKDANFTDAYGTEYASTGFKIENGTSLPFSAMTLENVSNDTSWFNSSFDTQYALTGFGYQNLTHIGNIDINTSGSLNVSGNVTFTGIICPAGQVLTTTSTGILTCVVDASSAAGDTTLLDIVNQTMWDNSTTARLNQSNVGNLNITGNFSVDTATFFVDEASNKVGIGTASPEHPLTVIGTVDITGDTNISGTLNVGDTSTNEVTGTYSASIGENCDAGGYTSFCTGLNSIVSGSSSMSGGSNCDVSGTSSFCFGTDSTITGDYNILGGDINIINSDYSGIIGTSNTINLGSDSAVVFGSGNEITPDSDYSFIMGLGNRVAKAGAGALGKYINNSGIDSIVIGSGIDANNRLYIDASNIFAVGFQQVTPTFVVTKDNVNISGELNVIGNVNVTGTVNATKLNGTLDCTMIGGGSDADFCADATSTAGDTSDLDITNQTMFIQNYSTEYGLTGFKIENYSSEYSSTGFKIENGTALPFSAMTLENISNETGWFNDSYTTQYTLTGFDNENFTNQLAGNFSDISLFINNSGYNYSIDLSSYISDASSYQTEASAWKTENASNDTSWFNNSFDTQYALTGFKIENGTSLPFSNFLYANISEWLGVPNASIIQIGNISNILIDTFKNENFTARYDLRTDRWGTANETKFNLENLSFINSTNITYANGQLALNITCEQITGSSALCDGDDAVGAGGDTTDLDIANVSMVDNSTIARLNISNVGNLNITGNFSVDTDTFFINENNNKIGIGTTTPPDKLVVVGDSGKIVATPSSTTGNALICVGNVDYNTGFQRLCLIKYEDSASGTTAGLANANLAVIQALNPSSFLIYTNTADIVFGTTTKERMRIESTSGNIGINVTGDATTKLEVGGNASVYNISIKNSDEDSCQIWHNGSGICTCSC